MRGFLRKLDGVNLGKVKTWQNRITSYVSIFNFLMLFYLFIVENKWFEWYVWLLLSVVSIFVIFVVDTFWVLPQQLAYSFQKNPEWKELRNEVKEIKDQIDKLRK